MVWETKVDHEGGVLNVEHGDEPIEIKKNCSLRCPCLQNRSDPHINPKDTNKIKQFNN